MQGGISRDLHGKSEVRGPQKVQWVVKIASSIAWVGHMGVGDALARHGQSSASLSGGAACNAQHICFLQDVLYLLGRHKATHHLHTDPTLGFQLTPEKLLGPSKPTPNTCHPDHVSLLKPDHLIKFASSSTPSDPKLTVT